MTAVLDASAVLALLQGEKGATMVEEALLAGARCGAANWAEVAQQVRDAGRDWPLASALLDSYGLRVEPVLREDAERAARRWVAGDGLSLGDRLCLAAGERFDEDVLTADTSWGADGRIRRIR